MNAKHSKPSAGAVVKDIRRATRKQYGAEEKIRIVLEGLRGEDSIAELCPRELAVTFTDEQRDFVSEASVYRLLARRAAKPTHIT